MLVWRAAQRLGIGVSAAEAAEADGLLKISVRVTFRHPLVRSAVYRAASPHEKQAVHRALADATDPDSDPDRRAWHLAQATAGLDDDVASELERSAGRAQARGGLAAAAAFLERAVRLTVDPQWRARRALAAAQAKHHGRRAGCRPAAAGHRSTRDRLIELGSARVDLLRAQIAFASSHGSDAPPLLLAAAKRLEALDIDLRASDLPGCAFRGAVRRPPRQKRWSAGSGNGRVGRTAAAASAARVRSIARWFGDAVRGRVCRCRADDQAGAPRLSQ